MPQVQNLSNKLGQMAGWNSVKIPIFGRVVEGILKFSYDDDTKIEAVKGAGHMPIGISDKTDYEAKVDLELYQEEVFKIQDAIQEGKRISDMIPVDIPVEYDYQDRVRKDIVRNFVITGFGKSLSQGDGTVKVKVNCFCTHIDWNVK